MIKKEDLKVGTRIMIIKRGENEKSFTPYPATIIEITQMSDFSIYKTDDPITKEWSIPDAVITSGDLDKYWKIIPPEEGRFISRSVLLTRVQSLLKVVRGNE